MPAISAGNLTRLRTSRHATRLGLVVYPPPVIWSARVNGAQAQGAQAITVDGVTTNYFAPAHVPAKNFLVGFSATGVGGSELGTTLFKSYGAPTLNVGVHNVDLVDDVYITVWEVVPPTAIPYETNTSDVISEDGNVAYTDENENFMPLARCGTHAVLYIDSGTGLATGRFYDRSTGIGGATIASVLWMWRGGTQTVGTTATPGTAGVPNVVTWNAVGNYYCSLTVTDSNGKTHTRWFVVFVRKEYEATVANRVPYVPGGSGTLAYREVEVQSAQGDADDGTWNARVRVHTTADYNKFPERALVVLFADDWYGAERVSIGNETWRENIRLVGYTQSGTVVRDLQSGYVEFEVASVSGVMEELVAFQGELESTSGSPTAWHQVKDLTYNLGAHHLLTQHSTISQVCDVYLDLPDYTIAFLDLAGHTLADQLRDFLGAVRSQMGCNAQGHLYLCANPQLQAVADRSTTYVLDTTSADFRDQIDFGEGRQTKAVSQVVLTGQTDIGDVFFSVAPGRPWLTGKPENVEGIRVADQTEANAFSGLFEKYLNANYREVSVAWRGDYPWDVFPREPFRMSVTAAQNRRSIVWTNRICWTRRVNWSYRGGILLVDTVIERDNAYQSGDTGGGGQPGDEDGGGDEGGEGGGGGPVPPGGTVPPDPLPPGGFEPPGGTDPNWPPDIPTPTLPPPTIPSPTIPTPPGGPGPSGVRESIWWSDGWIAVTGSQDGIYGLSPVRCRVTFFAAYADTASVTIKVYCGQANADIEATYDGADWTLERHDGGTGALISTTVVAGPTANFDFVGTDVIDIPARGYEVKGVLEGAVASTVAYCFGGVTY